MTKPLDFEVFFPDKVPSRRKCAQGKAISKSIKHIFSILDSNKDKIVKFKFGSIDECKRMRDNLHSSALKHDFDFFMRLESLFIKRKEAGQ